jgi:hypothetical protein
MVAGASALVQKLNRFLPLGAAESVLQWAEAAPEGSG